MGSNHEKNRGCKSRDTLSLSGWNRVVSEPLVYITDTVDWSIVARLVCIVNRS